MRFEIDNDDISLYEVEQGDIDAFRWPKGIKYAHFSMCYIQNLHNVPDEVTYLDCSYCALRKLCVPLACQYLNCSFNYIEELVLPPQIKSLNANENHLKIVREKDPSIGCPQLFDINLENNSLLKTFNLKPVPSIEHIKMNFYPSCISQEWHDARLRIRIANFSEACGDPTDEEYEVLKKHVDDKYECDEWDWSLL